MSYVQVADDDILDDIVGIYKDWTETSAAWHYCDCDGDPITLPVGWQNRHPILPNLKTCLVDTLGVPTFGSNPQVNVEVALKTGSTTIETVKGSAMVFDYPEHRNLGTNEAFVVQCTSADRVIGGVDYYVEAA
jgi:hypothetical protein